MTALSGRPAPPKRVRRSAIPGLVLLVAAFALLTISPGSGQGAQGHPLELILGLVALIGAVILLCPMCLAVLARLGRRTAAGYVAAIAWFRGSALNGGVGALANAPVGDLLFIVVGMPLIAVAVGWLLAGREPPAIAHRPME